MNPPWTNPLVQGGFFLASMGLSCAPLVKINDQGGTRAESDARRMIL